jgi:transcription elongation GreA/GreB family factor
MSSRADPPVGSPVDGPVDGPPDKAALHGELVTKLQADLQTAVAAQRLTAEGVTHPDARSDGSKDMRATEASYIARGQALRAETLESELARVRAMPVRPFGANDAVALSALVTVDDGEQRQQVFVAPGGGGTRLGAGVQVITPSSPLGKAIVGARLGDFVELRRGGAEVEVELVAIF